MRVKLNKLIDDSTVVRIGKSAYVNWQEHIKGYVTEEYIGDEYFASIFKIIVERNGKLYAFEDWRNSEGENGLSEVYTYSPTGTIVLRPVKSKEVTTITYEYIDEGKIQ